MQSVKRYTGNGTSQVIEIGFAPRRVLTRENDNKKPRRLVGLIPTSWVHYE